MQKLMFLYAKRGLLPWLGLAVICLLAFIFMSYAAFRDAAVMDELAHIPAGYGYVSQLDFRLNPEHPPLLKALSALPLLLIHPNFPVNAPAWETAINGQWDMGSLLLYGAGNNADQIVRVARLMPILLTIALIILVYLTGRKTLGKYWALLPAFFVAFSPTFLAHGHYVTTDIAATFGILLATHFFLKALDSEKRKDIFWAGIAFGVAELLKFSTVLLIPFFILLVAIKMWTSRKFWVPLKTVILVGLVGYLLVVFPVYALFTLHYPIAKQVSDTSSILTSFGGGPAAGNCSGVRCLAELDIWMAHSPILRPFAEYMLGVLMVMQRADGGNTAYFLGQVSAGGSHWYFPAVYALKETIPALIFVLIAALGGLIASLRSYKRIFASLRSRVEERFWELAWLIFIVFYWAWSVKSPLNIGFRHVLSTLPLMYLLAAGWWRRKITHLPESGSVSFAAVGHLFTAIFRSWLKFSLLVLILLWAALETLVAAPSFLSYFNEFAGGTMNGYKYVTDSNYDWGQDLLLLKKWSDEHPSEKVAVDYFGGGSPSYYLGSRAESWWSSKGNPKDKGVNWFAISIGNLQNSIQKTAPGFERKPEDSYPWLTNSKTLKPGEVPAPEERIGTSIFLYKL